MSGEKIAVSACLLGCNCKYNGGNNYHAGVIAFCRDKQVISVCPEVLAGLPTPRTPMELVNGRMTDRNGADHHDAMTEAVGQLLSLLQREGVRRAILQSRSPSCGVREIYDGSFSGKKIPGSGIFARALREAGIEAWDAEKFERVDRK